MERARQASFATMRPTVATAPWLSYAFREPRAINCGWRGKRARQDSEPLAMRSESRRFPETTGRGHLAINLSEVARPAGLEPATLGLEGQRL